MTNKLDKLHSAVKRTFVESPFVQTVGIELLNVDEGICEATLNLTDKHLQHLGRAHGAAVTTLAGQTALGAVTTILSDDEIAVSPEFKMNLFRPTFPGRLTSKATVVKNGRVLVFVESEVFAEVQGNSEMVAKGSFTFTRLSDEKVT